MQDATTEPRLYLPSENEEEWNRIESLLRRPLVSLSSLDDLLNEFHSATTKQTCKFFSSIKEEEKSKFDWNSFETHAVPFMIQVALEMPTLFSETKIPLLLKDENKSVTLTRRQCACLLAHSFFGSITSSARRVENKKWSFRASQLFFLEATPSALCFLNYFKRLAMEGIPSGSVTIERVCFKRGSPPWKWENNQSPLCPIEILNDVSIERSSADFHADFANKFIGGGCLENDFAMEEILFIIKPELIISMAITSHMVDEDSIRILGALQYSKYTGYSHTFEFDGDFEESSHQRASTPSTVFAMDALQGCAKIQFQEGLIRRDLNKARIAFGGAKSVATGNWGCGAFGNDHLLKFLQQWMAASDASVERLYYHTYGDKRTDGFSEMAVGLQSKNVGQLWEILTEVAGPCAQPGPGNGLKFRKLIEAAITTPSIE